MYVCMYVCMYNSAVLLNCTFQSIIVHCQVGPEVIDSARGAKGMGFESRLKSFYFVLQIKQLSIVVQNCFFRSNACFDLSHIFNFGQ
jgi:hypothetical protein